MTSPIGSQSRAYTGYSFQDDHSTSADASKSPLGQAASSMCRNATSVAAGYLCDEDTVISNACRTPKNVVDKTLCDDAKLQKAQDTVLSTTVDAIKAILSAMLGKAAK